MKFETLRVFDMNLDKEIVLAAIQQNGNEFPLLNFHDIHFSNK
jgi:hypothetical protein